MNTNEKTLKIVIISHALVQEVAWNRWKLLAKDSKYEVHLIIPRYWESYWFKEKIVFQPREIKDGNFNVHTLEATDVKNWGKYFLKGLCRKIKEISPDLIYIVHEEIIRIHHQIYLCNWLNFNRSKIIFFSMNAMGVPFKKTKNPIKKIIHWLMFQNIKLNTKAALAHYPGCLESLRNGGYNKPIYLQAQVGVDETLFASNKKIREEYRKKIGFSNNLIIGYSGRLVKDKGVDDLVEVFIELSKSYKNISLLLVGNGDLKEWIEKKMKNNNLENRIYITGFVDQAEVPNYMNAMDIFVLGSKTMPYWIDTFPLVTVQAQSIGLPVIASNSGSIPWQLSDSAKIFPEGDRKKLKQLLIEFIENKDIREYFGKKGQERSHKYFCHRGMTENFKKIINQVLTGNFIYHKKDEPYTQWKAY